METKNELNHYVMRWHADRVTKVEEVSTPAPVRDNESEEGTK